VESNWKPLEERLGSTRCAGFMFMGRVNGINQYKHGISRYLFLDDEGRTYEATGRNRFREIPVEEAIARVEAPLQEIGETLEQPTRLQIWKGESPFSVNYLYRTDSISGACRGNEARYARM
jgi:hypothetical protein